MYKIEIWQYYSLTETYESDNVEEILDWYKCHWKDCYEYYGGCAFDIYKDDELLSFEEERKLGFH